MRTAVGDRDLVMVGIRPERFDDESLVDPSKAAGGTAFDAEIDVVEWLGNEQYAYIPYSATPEAVESLAALERDLDNERLRDQLVIALDPSSRISDHSTARIWFDPRHLHVFDPSSGDNLTRAAALGATAPA